MLAGGEGIDQSRRRLVRRSMCWLVVLAKSEWFFRRVVGRGGVGEGWDRRVDSGLEIRSASLFCTSALAEGL